MTIRFIQGNLLDAPAEALVNTVNEVGVMGKGIALQFRDAFPESAREYVAAAEAEKVKVGRVFVTYGSSLLGPKWIIHFPTKKHWRNPSQLTWIRDGLKDLARVIQREGIHSIALPPLGCGNGGLQWNLVRKEIAGALGGIPDVEITVFEPTSRYHNAPKPSGVEELTPPRALIAELIRRYAVLGIECSLLEVQKLAWFLSRALARHKLDAGLKLEFKANSYGPYDDHLRHLLEALDGSYLHSEKRLADAKPLDVLWFDEEKRGAVEQYLASSNSAAFIPALEEATAIIDGFQSPLGMELLATVDWLMHEQGVAHSLVAVREGLAHWSAGAKAAARKQRLFDDRMLAMAIERLTRTLYEPALAG
ncbi:MAG TPA: macro domain-containing protein [Gemmatimonadales bacterium]|jgi:O-acetyl-ADP-ribose deacetylase (regulator of RNase III)